MQRGNEKNERTLTPLPPIFVSIESKEVSDGDFVSMESKGLRGEQCGG